MSAIRLMSYKGTRAWQCWFRVSASVHSPNDCPPAFYFRWYCRYYQRQRRSLDSHRSSSFLIVIVVSHWKTICNVRGEPPPTPVHWNWLVLPAVMDRRLRHAESRKWIAVSKRQNLEHDTWRIHLRKNGNERTIVGLGTSIYIPEVKQKACMGTWERQRNRK